MNDREVTSWSDRPNRRQLGWYLLVRVLFISIFLGGTIVYQFSRSGTAANPSLPFLYALAAISYLQAIFSALILPRLTRLQLFTQFQIAWDLFFCLLLIYATGGQESPFSFVFIFVIFSASVFFAAKEVVVVAATSSILYGSLIDLQYFGRLPQWQDWAPFARISTSEAFYAVFVHVVAFLLTALLSGALSERWRRSELALQEKQIDFRELEVLNAVILANISSGLMIVNPQGRIRSFNEAAAQITGYSLVAVYNADVRKIFPTLEVMDDDRFRILSRAEAKISNRLGEERIIGYATTLLRSGGEKDLGLLITFQDLTQVKAMEEQLQRADRLAAVGRLSAGMAHEIRNPLAAISGSVQLLMEGEGVSSEDRRLMGIVVREADRLSALLSDFLRYTRPKKPDRKPCDLDRILAELVEVASHDQRFERVRISCSDPGPAIWSVDCDQLRQALWDLLINAADVLQGEGVIRIRIDSETGSIVIEDNGPGIPAAIRERIFEPFFTTKQNGTGLGLAAVYSIVEAHGGTIEVGQSNWGGARFAIRIPDAG